MKVNCWDKCFLCLTNLGSTSLSSSCGGKKSRGSQKPKEITENPNLRVLMKYLLGTWDQSENDSLLQRIRRLQQQNSTSSSEGLIKFCDNCQDSAQRISHLQMELDVIQMKIVDILGALRKTVIDNSNGHHDGTSGLGLEEFTEERQEILDTLHAFQAAVVEKSKESVHVPLVYIQKFTGCNLKTNLSNPAQEENFLIKTEPEADPLKVEEILSDLGDDHVSLDYDQPINQFNEGVGVKVEDDEMDTNNGNLSAIIKEETGARQILEVKKLSRPSLQYPPNKNKNKKESETKTTPLPHHPPTTKTGKIFRTPKNGRKKYTSSSFVCEICSYKTPIHFQFEHHLSQHESPEVVNHICHICTNPPRQFSHQQSFDFHMNSHSGLNKIMCDLCPKFLDPFSILEHLLGHSNVEKVFQCSCCSYRCGTREAYLKHIRYHATSALVCDVCSKKFRRHQRMLEHMHDEHNLLEKVKCDVANCDKEFFDTVTMKKHKKRHTEAFVCSECNLQFPGTRNLLRHQVRAHSREKPIRCSECPETFIEKQSLRRHLIKAHGASKLKCPHCPKEFVGPAILAAHINLHEGISFPCDQCDKVFGDRGRLTSHQVVHKTTKDFICEECGKAFRYEKLLRGHIKIHIGDKKHKCRYCSKGFVDRPNLICHERIHTGEKPYVCEACGKDFNQRSTLKQHMRTQHKELIAIKN